MYQQIRLSEVYYANAYSENENSLSTDELNDNVLGLAASTGFRPKQAAKKKGWN